ncbi:Flp pilus assembly protein CpaB [uncultured Alphaproteobacteria bacterium]|uniref:Flp pilus assembly protein CpaB n=1 Tax=uncultured Alphaproteobacteria bacterium TaxID=91750 RepID=A0A212KJC7_9PROT|nr:Flp pilus assembly protein CpaB [uncultured Alphaproteobacteria bacterium]
MKPVVAIVALLAVLAAVGTAVLAQRWVAGQAARPVAAQPAPTAEVLVVAREVAAGAALTDEDLRYEPWPTAAAQRFVVRTADDDPKARVLGAIPRRPLTEGEPFQESSVARTDAGLLAVLLEPGTRAVSVPISAASAASGFINPGDRVDVVLAADFQRTDEETVDKGGAFVRYASETVLTDVKVLAIDQQIARDKDGAAIVGKTAAIAVTPRQAEVLATAGMLGQLSLVLRPQGRDDAGPEPAQPYTADIDASRAMHALTRGRPKGNGGTTVLINRAGEISERRF